MNELLVQWGLEGLKPTLTALVLPPVPLLLLMLVGAWCLPRRRALGWGLVLVAVLGSWAVCTTVVGIGLQRWLLQPPPVLERQDLAALQRTAATTPTSIVVLGGGLQRLAPEYGASSLKHYTLERLRYGLWLSRETGLPVGLSGGVGHGSRPGASEAEIAERIAEREFGRRLAWIETESRDTNENAQRTVAALAAAGVHRIVLVTHGFHMGRAVAAFERAAQRNGRSLLIVPAPMGMAGFASPGLDLSDLLPSAEGFEATRLALREWLGRRVGA